MIDPGYRLSFGLIVNLLLFSTSSVWSQETIQVQYATAREGKVFKIYQFSPENMPQIDGKTLDWESVPASYTYNTSYLNDTEDGHGQLIDTADIDVKVTVGWVNGLNRLYFLYEAYDDFWDFKRFNPKGYLNDIFEIVVDGDMSGGPFIYNPLLPEARKWGNHPAHIQNHLKFSGYHAQNYHIFTPPVNGSWTLIWGSQPWIASFPYAHRGYDFDFKQGESGKLTLEFWITPFDHAPFEGPELAVESQLYENKVIGLSWSVLDFDGAERDGHYNLSHDTRMVADASYLCAFRLMPLEKDQLPDLKADWTFELVKNKERTVAFKDESIGDIEEWYWDFGNGDFSREQHPVYQFPESGVHYNVTLEVSGAVGKDKKTRFWEVMVP
ncbi:PKD domain-containing protein [Cyclobacterium jeungdonense]|uniref:PKD domain-containing protein n=1 Tax=Cyclobacterium jeungdonense TaxID=708087 RepID=A0ABT8CBR3_9BACT|nr:PKD domain-containing protein [Cyclobacterium jeungdonense]MDN3689811.1 PKD domain-containing protein [Cyclobacterium jeungdonense]